MKEMICIVCPRGCHLKIDENTLEAQGNTCPRGEEYAKNEIVSPMRTITGSVGISGGIHPRLAVRTNRAVPKSKMFEIMAALHACKVHAPVKRGDVIIENVCGTGANVIASRDM
jgi:CxxC motif-containing protein